MCKMLPTILAIVILICNLFSFPNNYDLLIKNGRIFDGSGQKSYLADIAVNADTIAAIGDLKKDKGTVEIDAAGLAVAPGFINMLSWAGNALIEDGRSQGDIRQGVTLEVMGEGTSMGPLTDTMKVVMKENQQNIIYDIEWTTLGEYLQFLEDKGISTNVASFIGNGTLRIYTIGFDPRPATAEEMEKMKELTRQAMQEGAMGLSTALIYTPSMNASTEEITELAKVVSEYDGMYVSHIRGEGKELLQAVNELISICKDAAVRSEIYHFKASGVANWGLLDKAIKRIDEARAQGLPVTTDMYMYNASSTGLNVVLPKWAREEGHDKTRELIEDKETRQKVIGEIELHVPPENVLFVGFRNDELRSRYVGRTLADVAAERQISAAEAVVELIHEDDSRIQVVYFSMSEENIKKKLKLPYMAICSDAGSYAPEGVFLKQSTHPRAYGSFARLLGKYVRGEQVITLQEAVRRMTSLPAGNLKLKKRGALKQGYFADIVIFDPDNIKDNATFEKPHQYATGMRHVFVNGTQVLKDGEHTGAFPGRFVKGPGYKK